MRDGGVRKRERELEKDSSRNSPLDWFSIIREREERERREIKIEGKRERDSSEIQHLIDSIRKRERVREREIERQKERERERKRRDRGRGEGRKILREKEREEIGRKMDKY